MGLTAGGIAAIALEQGIKATMMARRQSNVDTIRLKVLDGVAGLVCVAMWLV